MYCLTSCTVPLTRLTGIHAGENERWNSAFPFVLPLTAFLSVITVMHHSQHSLIQFQK